MQNTQQYLQCIQLIFTFQQKLFENLARKKSLMVIIKEIFSLIWDVTVFWRGFVNLKHFVKTNYRSPTW